jgi:hypothetical protein
MLIAGAALLLLCAAAGMVFAQVCLGPAAAYVEQRGRSVYVLNKMMDSAINVRVTYTYWSTKSSVSKTESVWARNLPPSADVRLPLEDGINHKLTGYSVETCY